jgi:hypothetical protein
MLQPIPLDPETCSQFELLTEMPASTVLRDLKASGWPAGGPSLVAVDVKHVMIIIQIAPRLLIYVVRQRTVLRRVLNLEGSCRSIARA